MDIRKHHCLSRLSKSQDVYISTRPDEVARYRDMDLGESVMIAESLIDIYQFYNRMIRYLVRAVPEAEFSSLTSNLLRCSVKIHPFLEGVTEDSGYPEEAILAKRGSRWEV